MIGSLAACAGVGGLAVAVAVGCVCVCVLKFLKHATALTTPKIFAYDRFVTTSLRKKKRLVNRLTIPARELIAEFSIHVFCFYFSGGCTFIILFLSYFFLDFFRWVYACPISGGKWRAPLCYDWQLQPASSATNDLVLP
jgi:hypothetical protein